MLAQSEAAVAESTAIQEHKKERYRVLPGSTYQVDTPLGATFVTINSNGHGRPFEVFLTTGKAGSETTAVSEAIGRLISYILRLNSPIPEDKRLSEVARQLRGIGGSRPLGFGASRVLSLPDGVSQVLAEHLGEIVEHTEEKREPAQLSLFGDICPDCGNPSLMIQEGCESCDCGYSRC
jgi:ribonucleoside-diphosphate reductase alpha chain